MIYAPAGTVATAVLSGAPTGLVGTLTQQVEKQDGTSLLGAVTTGIVEVEPTVYVATRTIPEDTDPGTYVWVWVDPGPAPDTRVAEDLLIQAAHPASTPDPLSVEWRPALNEVATWILTRTRTDLGNYLGTFTADTLPTDDQAEEAITIATAHVASRLGSVSDLCADHLTAQARHWASLYAAMIIELSHYPEQVRSNKSNYPQLKVEFDDGVKELRVAVQDECGDVPGSEEGGSQGQPAYDFDASTRPLGREFVW